MGVARHQQGIPREPDSLFCTSRSFTVSSRLSLGKKTTRRKQEAYFYVRDLKKKEIVCGSKKTATRKYRSCGKKVISSCHMNNDRFSPIERPQRSEFRGGHEKEKKKERPPIERVRHRVFVGQHKRVPNKREQKENRALADSQKQGRKIKCMPDTPGCATLPNKAWAF